MFTPRLNFHLDLTQNTNLKDLLLFFSFLVILSNKFLKYQELQTLFTLFSSRLDVTLGVSKKKDLN